MALRILAQRHVAVQHLGDELLHQVLAAFRFAPASLPPSGPARRSDPADPVSVPCLGRRLRRAAPSAVSLMAASLGLPISPSSFFSFSVLPTASSSSSSSLSLPCRLPRRSDRLGPQLQQFAQRLHLPRHVLRREIVHALEVQVDFRVEGHSGLRSACSRPRRPGAASCPSERCRNCRGSLP